MSSLTYKDSGVDITKGNQLIEKIKPIAKSTLRPGVLGGLGGFGAMFEIPLEKIQKSSTHFWDRWCWHEAQGSRDAK